MIDKEKRVRYENGSLKEVIIQLRFPTILSVNVKQPVELQERIKDLYPFFQEQNESQNNVVVNPAVQEVSFKKISESKNYAFVSSDAKSKFNLTPSFIAFSSVNYIQWELFKENVEFLLDAFEELYQPPFYNRIGLHYINAFTREELGIKEKKWTELLQPHILGMISPENEDGVKSYVSEIVYSTRIEDVLSRNHVELVHINNQKEVSLLLDCDYFIQGKTIGKEGVPECMEKLHDASHHFIDNAITDELYTIMKPIAIE